MKLVFVSNRDIIRLRLHDIPATNKYMLICNIVQYNVKVRYNIGYICVCNCIYPDLCMFVYSILCSILSSIF